MHGPGVSAVLLIGMACGFDVEHCRRGRHQGRAKHVTRELRQPACSPFSLYSPCDHAAVLCMVVGFAKSRSSHSF